MADFPASHLAAYPRSTIFYVSALWSCTVPASWSTPIFTEKGSLGILGYFPMLVLPTIHVNRR